MRVIVCGSRGHATEEDRENLEDALWEFVEFNLRKEPLVLVHGACSNSADTLAHNLADFQSHVGWSEEAHPADWENKGKIAGFSRNWEMAEAGADLCIAVWDGRSKGTLHMIKTAVGKGIPVRIVPT